MKLPEFAISSGPSEVDAELLSQELLAQQIGWNYGRNSVHPGGVFIRTLCGQARLLSSRRKGRQTLHLLEGRVKLRSFRLRIHVLH
jgi:hypothetical protein